MRWRRRQLLVARQDPRFVAEDLRCNEGSIIDLSPSGMCVRPREIGLMIAGDRRQFVIKGDGWTITLVGLVVWSGSTLVDDHVEHRVGVEFIDVDRRRRGELIRLAVQGIQPASALREDAPIRRRGSIPDLYAAMGVVEGATEAEILHAYHEQIAELEELGPDDTAAMDRRRELDRVREILIDRASRAVYDDLRRDAA